MPKNKDGRVPDRWAIDAYGGQVPSDSMVYYTPLAGVLLGFTTFFVLSSGAGS